MAGDYSRCGTFRPRHSLPTNLVPPLWYGGSSMAAPECPGYAEDPAVCDDTGQPKGQCAACGSKEAEHAPAAQVPSAPETALVVIPERAPVGGPTTAAGQAILAINSNSHDLDDGVFKTFEVNGHKVRGMKIDGRAAMVGSEFARAMGYADGDQAVRRHCKGPVKTTVHTKGGPQEVVMIFAGDVNRLLVKSKLPSAQDFESLVFDTILPAIQETGVWTVPGAQLAMVAPPVGGMTAMDVAVISFTPKQ